MPSSSSWIRAEDVSFWSRHIMMLQFFPRVPMIGAVIYGCHSRSLSYVSQASQLKQCGEVSKFLDRRWMLHTPGSKVHQIMFSEKQNEHGDDLFGNLHFSINAYPKLGKFNIRQKSNSPSFYIVRDDLLHPLINGNKARKLDALLPIIEDYGGTDVVTCGGCQSAHAAAVAVSCAERGLTSHLLLRGEQPGILTGYNLISTIYGNVVYVPRSLYAKREEMLLSHAKMLAGPSGSVALFTDFVDTFAHSSQESNFMRVNSRKSSNNPPKKIVLVNEGAGDAVALLGVFRLVQYLSQPCILGRERSYRIVVDAGTGTTAVGLAIAALCLGLPWKIMAVMLADKIDGYKKQQMRLVSDFSRCFNSELFDHALGERDNKLVHWVDRCKPRKFGIVLNGEVKACQRVAKQTGVLLDPIYTLSAWELATLLCQEGDDVVMLHTGGTLGMFGLAQRYSSHFCSL